MKKIGKLMFFASAFAMLATFTACEPKEDEVIVEDGFYLAGDATGSDQLDVKYRMATGVNEDDDQKTRSGMYEKYVALEANKEFYLLLKEGNVETKYGAELDNVALTGDGDQPGSEENPFNLLKGSLVKGDGAKALKVGEDGLYHIILDLNLDKSLDLVGGAQIIIAPVEWGIRGINGDWGWNKMDASSFNKNSITYTKSYETTSEGDFKFAYGGGWKIQLDDAGNVKANTNLGVGLDPGADNIPIGNGENVKVTLTWTLATGKISASYALDLAADSWAYSDYSKAVFSLIGNAFNNEAGEKADWNYDIDLVYNVNKSNITDADKFYGTFVYEANDISLIPGEFKIRKDHDWGVNFGYSADNIKGNDLGNFSDNGGNIKVAASGTYDVSFKISSPEKKWELTLTKK